MPARVVDASAIAALLFGEPRGPEIARRLDSSGLAAPTLLRYEVGSVCLRKLRRYPAQRQRLLEAFSMLDDLALDEFDVDPREVLALAERLGLTVYDASYLWLARSLGAELVTLDSALRNAARRA